MPIAAESEDKQEGLFIPMTEFCQLLGWPTEHEPKQNPNENSNILKMGYF